MSSMNDNQNHLIKNGRSTSRVLAPPGGQSSVMIGMAPIPGMGPPPAATKKAAPKVEAPKATETKKESAPAKVSPTSVTENTAGGTSTKGVSANAFASGANANGAQVMTGRPTSRVLHPGGGGGPTQWTLG